MVRVTSLLAIVLALAPQLAGAAEGHPAREVVRRFFTAYVSGDVGTAQDTWTAARELRFRRVAERAMYVRCMRLERLELHEVAVSDDSATWEVDADLSSASAMPGDPGRSERVLARFHLVRDGEAWKITDWTEPELDTAKAIVAGAPLYETVREAMDRGARLRLIVRNLTRIGVDASHRGKGDQGLPIVEKAFELASAYADDDAISEALGARSIYAEYDVESARRLARLALAHAEKKGNPDVMARALLRLGRAEVQDGVTPLGPHLRMVAMADYLESGVTLANATLRLAAHFRGSGNHREALRYATESLGYARHVGEQPSVLSAFLEAGAIFAAQGDAEMAARYYRDALGMVQELGLSTTLPSTLGALAEAYYDAGRAAEGLAVLNDGFAKLGEEGSHSLLLSRSQLHLLNGDGECARQDARAATMKHELRPWGIATAWTVLSQVAFQQAQFEEALECAAIAVALVEEPALITGRIEHATALRALGRLDEAEASLRAALERIERQRLGTLTDARQLQMYAKATAAVYVELTDLLVDQGKIDVAAKVIANLHGRSLRDVQHRHEWTRASAGDEEHESLQRQAAEINRRLLAARADDPELRNALSATRLALDELHARRSLQRGPLMPLEPTTSVSLPPGVAVVEYVVARERVLAFVRRLETTEVVVLPATPAVVAGRVGSLLRAIESRDLAFRRDSRELYDLLLAPLDRALRGVRSLCVIPDGDLWSVPFHALTAPAGGYYGDRVSLFYAPSIGFLSSRPNDTPERNIELLAFANATLGVREKAEVRALFRNASLGPLPDAEAEVRELARMYGPASSRIYVGPDARESTFRRESARSRILHIATHGLVDSESPMYSSLLFSASDTAEDDGLLEAREIVDMQLDADLAVLSACDTGRGAFSAGEGVVGLAWAFMAAGCPTTVVSQWRVDSAATRELMVRFHERLRAGDSAPDALRAAQSALRANRAYNHPYYWAPFIVLGAAGR